MLDNPISLVGRFIEVTGEVSRKHLGTYLVVGIIKKRKVRPDNRRLPVNDIFILQESNSKRLYLSYISFSYDSIEYFIVAFDLKTDKCFRGYSFVNTDIKDSEIDRVLMLTSREQRLEFARRAIKHIQWRYARIVYGEKRCFNKIPRYRREIEWVLDPYFNPDKYIEKIM